MQAPSSEDEMNFYPDDNSFSASIEYCPSIMHEIDPYQMHPDMDESFEEYSVDEVNSIGENEISVLKQDRANIAREPSAPRMLTNADLCEFDADMRRAEF